MRIELITRRGVLAALTGAVAVGGLAGCDLFGGEPEEPPAPPNPLIPVLAATVTLAATYEAAFAADAGLAARYGAVRDNHWAHVDALSAVLRHPAPAHSPGPTAGDKAALLAAETAGAKAAYDACMSLPGAYAALLGSIAACRATHVEVLA